MNLRGIQCITATALIGGIFFILPIPHVMAQRNLLQLALIGMLVIMWKQGAETNRSRAPFSPEVIALGALTLWMLIQTSLWAVDRAFSFENFAEEWLGNLLTAWVGYEVVRRLIFINERKCASNLPAWVLLALFAQALWVLGWQAIQWMQTGHYPLGETPYGDYSVLSIPINMAFAILSAHLAERWTGGRRLLPWSSQTTWALLFVTIIAVIAVKARNGVLSVIAVSILLAALLLLRYPSKQTKRATLTIAILVATLLGTSLLSDNRWGIFYESFEAGLHTERHMAWLDETKHSLPTLPSGAIADHSAYMRASWTKIAVEGIASRPQGFGYGLGAFGHYIEAQYGRQGFISSHSGILDFTLANGIPGLMLFLVFCYLLFRRGWRSWVSGNPWGLALMLTMANYFVRILLDGHFGGFRLKMTALLLGILYQMTASSIKQKIQPLST